MPDSKALGKIRKSRPKDDSDELSNLNKILDKICQIQSTPGRPANHTHRDCWVFKQSGKLNAEHKGLDTPSEDDDAPPQAEHRRTKEVPTRSQNSKFTSCDKRKKQIGAYGDTRHTACPRGIQPLVVTTNHL